MLRKMVPVAICLLALGITGVGQNELGNQLRQQLLTQEEMQALLGTQWILDSVDELKDIEGATASAIGKYFDTSTENTLTNGLIIFENFDFAGGYLTGLLEAEIVESKRNLLEEAKDNPDLLTERIRNEAEQVFLLVLGNGLHQLMVRRGSLIFFFRTDMESNVGLEQLIKVADKQLEKTLAYCAEFAEGAVPTYCNKSS